MTARWRGLALAASTATLLLASCSGGGADDGSAGPGGSSVAGAGAEDTAGTDLPEITLAFAGDVHFAGGLAGLPARGGSMLGPMSRTLRQADLAMVNLEAAVTERGRQADKELESAGDRYWFRTPPAALDLLQRSGVDVVTVANNHGADYGAAGLRDTVRAARSSAVGVVGVGLTATEAFTPYRTTIQGTRVAVLGADASSRESADASWAIGPGSGPGLASARSARAAQLVTAVRSAAAQDDLVVVYLHWGEEDTTCPTGSQRSLASVLSAAGADIVVGSHAHEVQGAGTIGAGGSDTYVAYGLGNFFWYHGARPETGVLELTTRGGEVVDDHWVPGRTPVFGGGAQPLTGAAASRANSDFRGLRDCTGLAPGPRERSNDEGSASGALPAYAATVSRIGADVRARMAASGYPASCPVPLADLRYLQLGYVGFDGRAHQGELVVNADVEGDVTQLFGALYRARFPIARMRLVDDYGADDDRSMAANNTSAYNCRRVAGSSSWSAHAYGRAVDINPVQNPYVVGSGADRDVRPRAGREYVDVPRGSDGDPGPGVVVQGDVATSTMARLGWVWGATYAEPDYQHFSIG